MDPYTHYGSENLRCATDGGVVFSSTKCPPPSTNPMSERLEQTCELPFGFCYTPMTKIPKQLSTSVPSSKLPAGVMCIKCMSYLNLYCQTSEIFFDTEKDTSMMRWTCALCQSENIIAVENNNSNNLEEQETSKLLDTMISQRVVELRQPLALFPVNPPADSSRLPTKTIILVVDDNLPSTEVQAVGNVLQNVLDQTPEERFSWQIGLIVFGKSISIFKLGVVYSGIVVTDVVRSHEGFVVLTEGDSRSDISSRSYFGTSIEALLSCLAGQFNTENSSKDSVFTSTADTISGIEHDVPKKTRMQILKERKQSRLQRQQNDGEPSQSTGTTSCDDVMSSSWMLAREHIAQSKPPYRCTGDALLCAIDLASLGTSSFQFVETTYGPISDFHESRILLFTNGCPNLGEGSVVDIKNNATCGLAAYSTVDSAQLARACNFYDVIGKSAVDVGVGIDVFCTGSSELGFPAYLSLVEASSGYVISHDSFASSRLQFNVGYVLQHTHMSLSVFPTQNMDQSDAGDIPESSQTLDEIYINGCTVDLRMSR